MVVIIITNKDIHKYQNKINILKIKLKNQLVKKFLFYPFYCTFRMSNASYNEIVIWVL